MDYLQEVQNISRDCIPKCDFHMHTTWTDGKHSSTEMYDNAVKAGLEYILFSEHARKTSGDWFLDFATEIRSLPDNPCKALVGVETKVDDFEGNLDCVKKIVEACDLVMASVHRFPGEKGVVKGFAEIDPKEAVEIEKKLSLVVLENKNVNILGHPFGMSYRRFKVAPTEGDFLEVIRKAASTGVAIEINSHYHPNPWQIIEWCQSEGARISLGSNAHEISKVGQINRILNNEEKTWTQ